MHASGVFERALTYFRTSAPELKEERAMLLEEWLNLESSSGEVGDVDLVRAKLPKKLKKRRQIETEDGPAGYVQKSCFYKLHLLKVLIVLIQTMHPGWCGFWFIPLGKNIDSLCKILFFLEKVIPNPLILIFFKYIFYGANSLKLSRYEEYIDYLFPEESQTTNLKILEAAYKWKKQKVSDE